MASGEEKNTTNAVPISLEGIEVSKTIERKTINKTDLRPPSSPSTLRVHGKRTIMIMGAYARWRALTAVEQWATAGSAITIGAAVVALRVFGVARTLRIASRPVKGRTKTVIGDIVAAVERAGRYVPGATCLTKSLALAWMLRRRGVPAAVCIGVKIGRPFEAHAWVENGGVALNDPQRPAGRYAAF